MIVRNKNGLVFEFHENGSIRSIHADSIRISLKASSPFDGSGTNLYLRKRGNPVKFTPLLGPESESRFEIAGNTFQALGSWSGLDYTCALQLADHDPGWQWIISVKNTSQEPVELDLVWKQDVGLKPVNAGLINEYYVSQYLERRILEDEELGSVVCCRQNMKESTGYPWLMLACLTGAASASTDGIQFYGLSFRESGIPLGLLADRLEGEYAGESSVVALQGRPFTLLTGESYEVVFTGIYRADHPVATSEKDLELIEMTSPFSFSSKTASGEGLTGMSSRLKSPFLSEMSSQNPFHSSHLLPVTDLDENELNTFFGLRRRHPEHVDGHLVSFFDDQDQHIVLREKELLADRPHGHIMQAGNGMEPDERIVSTTTFMFGVFNSHLTQGNTNFNVLLSICTSQFNQSPDSGQRIFVEMDGKRYLLGVPSAFEMGLNHCRWIYRHRDHCFQVRTWTSKTAPQVNMDFMVLSGDPVNLIITHDFDPLNGWQVLPGLVTCESVAYPKPGSMILSRYPGARFRVRVQDETADYRLGYGRTEMESLPKGMESLFLITVNQTSAFCMSFLAEVADPADFIGIADAGKQFNEDCRDAIKSWNHLSNGLSLEGENGDIAAIRAILPWYGMNALTHFLTPYGLEQFGGAAWGTRDVSQGPVDLLLTLEKYPEARKVLCTIFSNQNPDGGWPQWWMFDRYFNIRAHESHGDIFYWCLIAMCQYIRVTGDAGILDEILPYYHEEGLEHADRTPLGEHVDRLVDMIIRSFLPGTALVPFGGGDWNDSLQPVNQSLASRMISSWTVEMCYQAFSECREIYLLKNQPGKADLLNNVCQNIKADFNRHLVKDDIVAGYGLLDEDGSISVLLHPQDAKTGIRYSLLPMERGINSGIFNRQQAEYHLQLIGEHLKGPDGARLMDRPLRYKGGIQEIFQRAESSTFFGREIGLMYVHEHIRYAEALAGMGRAEEFVEALRQAIPVDYRDAVPCGDIRQANCYYSSSDVHFKSRYEADERYEEVIAGKYPLRGGWRVYSSGPGIYIGLILKKLLGIRLESDRIVLDPVMPGSFDGLRASMELLGHPVTFCYHLQSGNFSPKSIRINGINVVLTIAENPYRMGGAVIPRTDFLPLMNRTQNLIDIIL